MDNCVASGEQLQNNVSKALNGIWCTKPYFIFFVHKNYYLSYPKDDTEVPR